MNTPALMFRYFEGFNEYESDVCENDAYKIDLEVSDDKISAKLYVKKPITLRAFSLSFDYDYSDALFFANGYQSWSTSKEYSKDEKSAEITPAAFTKGLKDLAGISSDCRFVNIPNVPGRFRSHCYTYVRRGDDVELFGSLSEKYGFTVFYADMNLGVLEIVRDIDGAQLLEGETYELLNVAVLRGGYDDVFDRYFDLFGVMPPKVKHMSGYTSWYNYFQKINEEIILRDLNDLDVISDSVSVFQVDDGYETFVGDWLDSNPAKFPHGMGYIADEIHKKGYMAGIWLAPFNVQIKSRTYKEHPDWVIKDAAGKPLLGCAGWGGAYTLDIYNPEAREYIRSVFDTVLNDWGYDMVKLDFLYSQCLYPRNGKSRGTIMCEAMAFLRECCGDKLILGCGVPLGAAFGYVDACRIGCDVDLKYSGKYYNKLGVNNEIPSAQNSIINAMYRRHLNGRAFCSDPDVLFLRYSNLKFDTKQKILLGGINHIFGGVLFVSDDAKEYREADIKAVKLFFSECNDIKVLSVDRAVGDKYVIRIEKDGKQDVIWFCLSNGLGNMNSVLGLSVNR